MATVIERVDRLEEVLQQFITSVGTTQLRTEVELHAFKDEMRDFKDENRRQIRKMNHQSPAQAGNERQPRDAS